MSYARSRWVVLSVVSLCVAACEDPPKPESKAVEAVTAAPPPAPTPPAAAAPKTEDKPKAPKKQLADCPKGPTVAFEQKGVEDEVRRKLPKPTGDITTADLKKLKSFNMSQVKGLEVLDVCI